MVRETHQAIPSMPAEPVGSPYWVGRDVPPSPAPAVKSSKDLPKIISTPLAIPPLRSKSRPRFTKTSAPVVSK
ncbi:MAG: hypothetical protein AAB705_03160 [Patescibacteria group bacterium]